MFREIKEDVKNILEKDPAAKSFLEVLLLYPGMLILINHRMAAFLYRHHWFFLARLVSQWGKFLTGIEIHPGARIGRRLFIDHGDGIVIGGTATIGDDCTIYHGATLGMISTEKEKRHPDVGHRVFIGTGAKILGAVKIGDDAKIGANSVVLQDVPQGATAVGVPARILLKRSEDSEMKIFYQYHI